MRVAIRRSLRVGANSGTEVEDLGIIPDERHSMTRADLLNGNVDLIEAAARILAKMPVHRLSTRVTAKPGNMIGVEVETQNVDLLDFYLDFHPLRSERVSPQTNRVAFDMPRGNAKTLSLQGFKGSTLAVSRRVSLS